MCGGGSASYQNGLQQRRLVMMPEGYVQDLEREVAELRARLAPQHRVPAAFCPAEGER